MLTNKNIVCPENLLNIAKGKGPVKAVIVNAVNDAPVLSSIGNLQFLEDGDLTILLSAFDIEAVSYTHLTLPTIA